MADAAATRQIVGLGLPATEEDDESWSAPPSRRGKDLAIDGEPPGSVGVVLSNQVYVDRTKLPPALVNRIIPQAAFQNPEFCLAQAMRLPTLGEPRHRLRASRR
jgi:hypothetical protein